MYKEQIFHTFAIAQTQDVFMGKYVNRFVILILSVCFSANVFSQKWVEMMNNPNYNFFEVQKEFNKYWESQEDESNEFEFHSKGKN